MVYGRIARNARGVLGTLLILGSALPAWAQAKGGKELATVVNVDDKEFKWGPAPAFLPKGSELGVVHGDPSKKDADIVLRIPAKSTIPDHWHTSAERMILLSGELTVTYAGQAPATLKAGSYAFGPAKTHHSGVCVSEVPCVLFVAFVGPVDAFPVTSKASN
jgi:quercetin dioxygenase-like cupin family protein